MCVPVSDSLPASHEMFFFQHGQHSAHSVKDEVHHCTGKTRSAKIHHHWGKQAPPTVYQQSEPLPLPKSQPAPVVHIANTIHITR